jgi:hypothetical protein
MSIISSPRLEQMTDQEMRRRMKLLEKAFRVEKSAASKSGLYTAIFGLAGVFRRNAG